MNLGQLRAAIDGLVAQNVPLDTKVTMDVSHAGDHPDFHVNCIVPARSREGGHEGEYLRVTLYTRGPAADPELNR